MKKVSVIGVGRVGLPMCLSLAEAGYKVYGIDVRKDYIQQIKEKKMPFVEENAQELLEKHVDVNFFPSTDTKKIEESEYIVLTIGTPVDEHLNPDYKQIQEVTKTLLKHLKKNQTIILRSTVSPGTTEYLKDLIEKETEMKAGKDFFLAFCPERIAQGKAIEETKEIPQIIGGIEEKSSEKAMEFFKPFTKEQIKTDAKSAELAKIFTNMYRYINFSIANEFMILAEEHERDIYEIINLINYNYKRGGIKQPGFAAGPCLYKDGFFLINTMPFNELISVSWKINETAPLYLLKKIKSKTELKHKKVALLGMSFKADNDDSRNSLSFKIKKALERENAVIECHDPLIKEFNGKIEDVIKDSEVIIVATNHSEYKKMSLNEIKSLTKKDCIVCDIWNTFGKNKIIYSLSE
ncbi:nucleotide sugar dehydrogenase [Candidatus Micrarchaeota archaeon]|nr:nucleotide sugar dehydrogenase [Candidatus Micrarchaeota archaeon]